MALKMARLPKPAKQPTPSELAARKVKRTPMEKAIAMQARLQAQERERIAAWIEQNNFNVAPYIKKWETLRDKARKEFVELAVEALAIADGAVQANDVIESGLGMKEAGLDIEPIATILVSLLKVRATQIFMGQGISKQHQAEILSRVIAREFPTADGPKPVKSEGGPRQITVEVPQQRPAPQPRPERPARPQRNVPPIGSAYGIV